MTVTAEMLQGRLCLPFGLSLFLPQVAFVTLVILPARNLGALSTNLRHRTSNFITLVKNSQRNWPGFTGGTYEEERLSGGLKIRHCMGKFRGAATAGEHGKRGSGKRAS